MQDMNSLPTVPQHMVDAMQREAEKKFGKVPGLEDAPPAPQMNPTLQHHEDVPETIEYQSEEPQQMVEREPQVQNTIQESANTDREYNFRAIRDKAKQAERERDEALRMYKELSERQQPQQSNFQDSTQPSKFNINPDDLVEGKHLNEFAQEIYQLKQQLNQNQQQTYMQTTEAKLRAQYPDLERVLSPDNIETFKMAYPELASSVASTSDYYTKAVSAYTMIKKFGIHQEDGNTHERQLIQKNIAKPKPLASVSPQQGDSPISRANAFANGFTKDVKEQLRKEMNQARQGY